jgi:hypothetical protein
MDTSTIEMLLGFTDLQVAAVEIQPVRIIVHLDLIRLPAPFA